jgi:hypothetical protein
MARVSSPALLPSIVVGASILVAAWAVTNSLDRTTAQLDQIKTGLAETKGSLEQLASSRPAPSAPANAPRRRGPDPNRRYTIARNGAPAKGPQTAKVKIFEFSDFQ